MRPARVPDAAALLHFWRRADAERTHTDNVDCLRRLIEHDREAVILAEDDGIIGSVIAGWDGWRGSIYRLVVAPEHRRTGLGRELVRQAERRLAAVGAVRSQAIVMASDLRAMGFWTATGWDPQTDRTRFVKG